MNEKLIATLRDSYSGNEPGLSVLLKAAEEAADKIERLREALGAHIQADAYRDTFPDDDEDAAYLRKQETWWRLAARNWLSDSLADECAFAAKKRALMLPETVEAIEKALGEER